MMASTERPHSDPVKIDCGASGCFNEVELECPICKLNVCNKHKDHNIKFGKESIKAHSK